MIHSDAEYQNKSSMLLMSVKYSLNEVFLLYLISIYAWQNKSKMAGTAKQRQKVRSAPSLRASVKKVIVIPAYKAHGRRHLHRIFQYYSSQNSAKNVLMSSVVQIESFVAFESSSMKLTKFLRSANIHVRSIILTSTCVFVKSFTSQPSSKSCSEMNSSISSCVIRLLFQRTVKTVSISGCQVVFMIFLVKGVLTKLSPMSSIAFDDRFLIISPKSS